MLGGASVFVVVPAFDEVARLPRVLETMPREVDHVIVVDDASTDGTGKIAEDVARRAADPRVRVISHAKNRGVGAAITTGYRAALAVAGEPRDAFVVMAGDGQMDPRDLPALVSPIARGEAGYVKGNRFAHDAIDAMPRARFFGGHVLSALTSLAVGARIHDSQCGYTAISRAACETLELQLDELWPRFGYPNDLLAMLARARITIAERPVRPVYPHRSNKLGARHLPIITAITLRAVLRRTGVALPRPTYYFGASKE